MSDLELRNIVKNYDKNTNVLNNINCSIESGEFMVLVGPSGCGKSTLLRIIAGLETPTAGNVFIAGQDVTGLSPAQRDIAMVFQDYALYPHMTVGENLSFALRIRKVPVDQINSRISTVGEMLSIGHLLDRRPAQLSGGQRQRVAIGRAIVRNPRLFLFDEPLSNLDAQLRGQTRIELGTLHSKLKTSVVYVTHDQVEAMTLADKIVVLNQGVIQQVGKPLELYHTPANLFVAAFIGSPSMNFFQGTLKRDAGKSWFLFQDQLIDLSGTPCPVEQGPYTLGIRPESIKILTPEGREALGPRDLNVEVVVQEPHGHEAHLIGKWGKESLIVRSANPHRLQVMNLARPGDFLGATIDRNALHWFARSPPHPRVPVSI